MLGLDLGLAYKQSVVFSRFKKCTVLGSDRHHQIIDLT